MGTQQDALSFGLGVQIYGNDSSNEPPKGGDKHFDNEDEVTSDSEEGLITAIASTSLEDSSWGDAPLYPPLYLETVSEYLSAGPKPKILAGVQVTDPLDTIDRHDSDISWAREPYENSMDVDRVFERFSRVASNEGQQCVRSVKILLLY